MRYRIISPVEDAMYRQLVNYAAAISSHFSICTFKYWHKSKATKNFQDTMNLFEKYEVDKYKFNTPKNYTKGQKFHVIELNSITKKIIESKKSFTNWRFPELPEDLTFYKNKHAWLYSIAHENLIFIEMQEKDVLSKLQETGLILLQE